MTDLPARLMDDGDERYERAKDARLDAAYKARIDSLTREQIEALYELAEIDYQRELTWKARCANVAMRNSTEDAACFQQATAEIARLDRISSGEYDTLLRARAAWAALRVKP